LHDVSFSRVQFHGHGYFLAPLAIRQVGDRKRGAQIRFVPQEK